MNIVFLIQPVIYFNMSNKLQCIRNGLHTDIQSKRLIMVEFSGRLHVLHFGLPFLGYDSV